jgi:hypothetical protein
MMMPIRFAYLILAKNPKHINKLYMRKGSHRAWCIKQPQAKDFISKDGHIWHILYAPTIPRKDIWGEVIPFELFFNDEALI